MNEHANDLERARSLGMTLDQFQALVGHDPLDTHVEFVEAGTKGPNDSRVYKEKPKKKKKEKTDADMGLSDNFDDLGEKLIPFETDEDVKNKTSRELEHYWETPIQTPADQALYYGFHVHSKDNMYGLHAHYPGGPLGGGHLHSPQNKLGYHTHRYNNEELLQFKFARPGVMIQLDGPHIHQHNAPDGKHNHSEENFGPASDQRAEKLNERNARVDKNIVGRHPEGEYGEIYNDE